MYTHTKELPYAVVMPIMHIHHGTKLGLISVSS